MLRYLTLLSIISIALCACLPKNAQTGASEGAALGSMIGQATGKNTEATLIGTAVGGAVGYVFAESMKEADRTKVVNAYEYNPDNHTSKWVNESTGSQFSITPTRTYVDNTSGQDCRDAEIISIIDGKSEKDEATACRKEGQWYFQ